MLFVALPVDVLRVICEQWLSLEDTSSLDIASCSHDFPPKLLQPVQMTPVSIRHALIVYQNNLHVVVCGGEFLIGKLRYALLRGCFVRNLHLDYELTNFMLETLTSDEIAAVAITLESAKFQRLGSVGNQLLEFFVLAAKHKLI